MNDDNELDPVARLRAADPAAGVEPRPGFADDVIARATGDGAASAPVADLAAARARRRRRWLPIAAAAAASLAIVGGVGYGLGTMTGGSSSLASGAAPAISLQGAGAQGAGAQGDGTQEGAIAGGPQAFAADGRKMAGSGASDLLMPYGYGRNSFSATGLATAAGTARAYAFDARAASNADTVAALAAGLGVAGGVEQKDGSWIAGPQDGTGPALYVSLDGTLSFSFSDPRISPWACVAPAAPDPTAPDQSTPDATMPVMPTCETPSTDLPGEAAAIDALRSLIVAAGRDANAFEFTSETWEGAVTRTAQAWPVVDGQRLDQSWSLELTQSGVVSASGSLADIVAIGEYDIVSEQQGFERLSDPRFGAQMTAMPFAAADGGSVMTEEWVPPTEPPATPTNGTRVSWPVRDVKIVGARLGLASQWQPDGSVLVVPAYEFTDADGGTWSVIAVADSKLDFATE